MIAIKVFIIFAWAVLSQLVLIESLRNASAVRDGTANPQPYVAQIRSIGPQEKRNSTGAILNKRWILAVASEIISTTANTFIYMGNLTYNGNGNIRNIIDKRFNGALALLKTDRSIIYTQRIKPAPLPTVGINYGRRNAIITGYGAFNNVRPFSAIRRVTNSVIQNNVNYTVPANQMVLTRNNSVCIDYTDAGSLVYVPAQSVLVGLILYAQGNASCATSANPVIIAARITKYVRSGWINNTISNLS